MADRPVTARVLLARMTGDDIPSVIAAVDETLWEHWTDEDEADWIKRGKEVWGIEYDTDFKVVVAQFVSQDLEAAFLAPIVPATVQRPQSEEA